MASYEAYFSEHWPVLQQAGLYRPGANPTYGNPAFEAASFRALVVRLSPFRDVMKSAPHLFLFQAVRRALPDAYIDMAFLPPEHDRARWLADGVPLLIGTQSRRDIADFDVVLISNAYSLELINLPYLLTHSGVPMLAGERDAAWPPLILGGSNAMAAQMVLTPEGDSIVDALFFGEGEREVEALLQALVQTRGANRSASKQERLTAAAGSVTGLWVANGPPDQQVVEAICHAPQSDDLIVEYPSLNSEEASTARLQVNFGCPAFCTFCFEGYDRKPYREVSIDHILAAADRLKVAQGVEAVDVYSFNFNTHEQILALMLELNRRFDRVHVKSQRVDLLAVMPSLMEAEVKADKRSFTIGVEGISNRMRAFLHKSLSDAEIESVLVRLMREKIREIKLFYILTGHEDQADLDEFHRFVVQLKAWRRQYSRGLRIVFSFGLLIRLPLTPLRYDRLFLEEEAWRRITGPVKSTCETNGFEFRLATPWDEYAASQVLALGGSWLCEPVIELARQGHLYDLVLTPGYWTALRAWMEEHGYWTDAFLGEKGPDAEFPLDFVKPSVRPGMLYHQYTQALAGVDEGYCLGEVGNPAAVGEPGRCLGCDACTTPEERAAITQHQMQVPGSGYLRELEETMRSKWRLQPVYARVSLPPVVAAADPAWLNAYLMRSLLARFPDLASNLLSVQESLFTTRANAPRYAGLYGETVVALKAWDRQALGQTLQMAPAAPAAAPPQALPGDVRFLGFLDAFEPGSFDRARLHLALDAVHFPDAGRQLRTYLQGKYIPVNLRGAGGGYMFDIPLKAKKKRVLFEGKFSQTDGRFDLNLVVSPKFDVVDYLKSFTEPGRYREALVEVVQLTL